MEALPPPTAEGLLAKTPLAHLFIYVMERRLTGSLELRRPDGAGGSLYFYEGIPRKARVPAGVATLGQVLVQHGVVTQEQANASMEQRMASGVLQGQVLLGMGVIAPDTLLGGLAAQLEAKILHLFEFPFESQFAFYEARDTLEGFGGTEIVEADPLRLLWLGVRLNPSWDHVNQTLARAQSFGLKLSPHASPDRCPFAPGELQAVDLLRQRPIRITDLTAARLMTPSVAQLFIYFFLITKQLELVEGPPAAPPRTAVARVQLQSKQVARGGAGIVEEQHAAARPDARMSPIPQAYAIPDAMRTDAIRPAPPPADVAQEAPPLSFAFGAPPPAPPSAPSLGSGEPPSSSSSSFRPAQGPFASQSPPSQSRIPTALAQSQSRISAAPPASDKPPGSVRPGRTTMSGAEDGLRSKILSKAEQVDHQSHYEILGVPNNAPKEDIQKAFFALAKVWHPDKLPVALGDVRDACSKVFSKISEAHSTLMDPARRGDYDNALRDGTGSAAEQQKVQEVLEAANNFQKALIVLKRNDTTLGEDLARRAYAADPSQADYLALVTWLDSQKPINQNRDKTNALIAKLDEAIKMNANCERAFFYRGMLHKRNDNMKQSIKDFKRAVELNAHNLDAAREIRLFSMRGPGAATPAAKPDDSIGGLFGRLFKK
jgi:DnaJ-domain-containing protein 1